MNKIPMTILALMLPIVSLAEQKQEGVVPKPLQEHLLDHEEMMEMLKKQIAEIRQTSDREVRSLELLIQEMGKDKQDFELEKSKGVIPQPRPARESGLMPQWTSQWLIGIAVAPSEGGVLEIVKVQENFPASKAGLKAGSKILSINDLRIRSTADLMHLIQAAGEQELHFKVESEGGVIENVKITPQKRSQVTFSVPKPAVGKAMVVPGGHPSRIPRAR